ncbi:tyrosine--tRNA ligase [soil metagenome]
MDTDLQQLLTENVATVHVRENLERKLRSGRPLRVKMGFDPSAPDIHLGHYVGLKKMRQFQDLGHTIVVIIGDWTAQIGDPSGRSAQRKMLGPEEVKANAQTYLDQFFKVVDEERAEVRWQSSWFGSFDLADVLRLTSKFTVAQMLQRDDFEKRYAGGSPIGIVEFLYPLLQAYDSVAVQADVEMGGTDQTFNLLVGRDIQREMGQTPQDILTVPILVGLDGEIKMSKSLNNYVGIDEDANQMYGKLMSIPDTVIETYLRLVSDIPVTVIDELVQGMSGGFEHPRDVKDTLAADIVRIFHGDDAATHAREEFSRVFREHRAPSDMPETQVDVPATIVSLILQAGLATSNNDARRLVQQGGVRIDGAKVTSVEGDLKFDSPTVLQVGRRRFVRLIPRTQPS